MKLEKVLDQLNSFEKNSFLKTIDSIITTKPGPKNAKAIDGILNNASGDLKAMDSLNIAKVFSHILDEYQEYLSHQFLHDSSQIDILTDILVRDGNCIMRQDWLSRLYESEIKGLRKKVRAFEKEIDSESNNGLDIDRLRDYSIYKECVKAAYTNDDFNNQDRKITIDEKRILVTLGNQLELSSEEVRLINYSITPLEVLSIDVIIELLRNIGVIFFSKKTSTIYIADEIVSLIRKVKGKSVADKFFRRSLRLLKDPQINLICKRHNIDRKLDSEQKIKEIIKAGISFSSVFSSDIYKPETTLTEKKKFINEFWEAKLKINTPIKGATLEDKIDSLIQHFDSIERDEKVGISLNGYEKLLNDLNNADKKFNSILKTEFELQDESVMRSDYLLDYNIKPRDVLEVIPSADLSAFCNAFEIKTRGDEVFNILESYKDSENLFLENYDNIAHRDIASLKENGVLVKEAELGILFENLTKKIFEEIGFNVDESLRKNINTQKDIADIILTISESEIIIVECKSKKESGYNKFSAVSRQLKSYMKNAEKQGYSVIKSLLVAPEFSDEFIKECGLEYELNLSLITAQSLLAILEGFRISKLKTFPHNLLMRDVLIQEDRIIKAITK